MMHITDLELTIMAEMDIPQRGDSKDFQRFNYRLDCFCPEAHRCDDPVIESAKERPHKCSILQTRRSLNADGAAGD